MEARNSTIAMLMAAAAAVPAAPAPAGDCMTFTGAGEFEAFNASVGNVPEGVEDLEAPASNVPAGVIVSLVHDPLAGGVPNVNTSGLGFPQGLLNPGLRVQSNLLGPGAAIPQLGGGLVAVGPGSLAPGVPGSVAVGANTYAHSADIVFGPGEIRTGVSFDVIDHVAGPIGGSIHVTVFSRFGAEIASVAFPAAGTATFFGIWCPQAIGRISVAGIGPAGEAGGELIDNLHAWHRSCPWDLDADQEVGIADLLDMLATWGPAPDSPADFDGDGTVGINDLLSLLSHWGPC